MSDLLASDLIAPDAGEAPLLNLPDVSILKAAPMTRLSLRCRPASISSAGEAFGAELPVTPLTSQISGARAAVWMGPDEWTLLAPEDDAQAVWQALEKKLTDAPHALVDISHRQDAILVSGEKAEWLLNTGIFIDLSEEAFPVGTITRTVFHKAPIMIWRIGQDTFLVEAWVSFMGYVSSLLVQSAHELEVA